MSHYTKGCFESEVYEIVECIMDILGHESDVHEAIWQSIDSSDCWSDKDSAHAICQMGLGEVDWSNAPLVGAEPEYDQIARGGAYTLLEEAVHKKLADEGEEFLRQELWSACSISVDLEEDPEVGLEEFLRLCEEAEVEVYIHDEDEEDIDCRLSEILSWNENIVMLDEHLALLPDTEGYRSFDKHFMLNFFD